MERSNTYVLSLVTTYKDTDETRNQKSAFDNVDGANKAYAEVLEMTQKQFPDFDYKLTLTQGDEVIASETSYQ